MLRLFGPGLPSDAIAHRFGYDGNESDDGNELLLRDAPSGVRSTFAINTYYQEIQGGHYLNLALFELIDQAMRSLGIFPVNGEYWRETGSVPLDGIGRWTEFERYFLVTEQPSKIGNLCVWAFHAGGGGAYYKDNMIVDLILPEGRTRQLVDEVERRCRAASVRFTREPDAPLLLPKVRTRWERFRNATKRWL